MKSSDTPNSLAIIMRIARDAVGVAASVRILFVDRAGQHLDGAHEQITIFRGGAFEVEHEMLELLGHDVEGVGEFTDFGAALHVDTLREVSAGDGSAEMGEHLQRVRNPAGGENADADTEGNGHDRQIAGVALHLIYAAVGLGTRLLHDHGPVQVGHRTVSAEHSDVRLAIADVEFRVAATICTLVPCLDEVPHDFQVGHVLTGGVVGGGSGDQPPLAVDDVRSEAASVDFLQAAYQELQVHD